MLHSRLRLFVAASFILAAAGTANAAIVTLNAVQDTFIIDRPSAAGQRDSTNDGTLLTNWNNGSNNTTSGRRRELIFQFDLSGISPTDTIVAANLKYYDTGLGGPNGASDQANPFVNDTYFVTRRAGLTDPQVEVLNSANNIAFDKFGMHEDNVTYNSYATGAVGGGTGSKWLEIATSSLNLSLAANNATSQYHDGGAADAGTLSSLNSLKNDYGYLMVLSWLPASNQFRTFGDIESGNPPQLVLDVIPEPSSYVLAGIALIGLVVAQRTGLRRSCAAAQIA
jgi:hypothetical protein